MLNGLKEESERAIRSEHCRFIIVFLSLVVRSFNIWAKHFGCGAVAAAVAAAAAADAVLIAIYNMSVS